MKESTERVQERFSGISEDLAWKGGLLLVQAFSNHASSQVLVLREAEIARGGGRV